MNKLENQGFNYFGSYWLPTGQKVRVYLKEMLSDRSHRWRLGNDNSAIMPSLAKLQEVYKFTDNPPEVVIEPSNYNCEVCGKPLTPIVYGYPDAETLAKAHRGQVILGGCIIEEPRSTHYCQVCKRKESFTNP